MSDNDNITVYSAADIEEQLRTDLPEWTYRDGSIQRSYGAHGWKGAVMLAGAVAHLAEAAWHHPDLQLSYGKLVVTLTTHSAGGVTDKDLELARRIEDLLMWRPAMEEGALEGTPDDPRYAYVKYS